MWARNLLFLGLIGGGFLACTAALLPRAAPVRAGGAALPELHDPAFRTIVDAIDNTFRRQWTEQHLQPASRASDLVIARRLTLGLMGTLPSLQEIRQVEQLPSEDRLSWWFAGGLHDRRFADYFAERLARAYVGTEDGPFIVYRRRRFISWLSDQVMANRRYDQLVRELITADGLWTDKPATNFLTVTILPDQKDQIDPVKLAGRATRAFLGLRLDCAQCHNHPFAKWEQRDFQGIAAFFGQTHQGFTGIYDGVGEYQLENRKNLVKETIEPRVPFAPELVPQSGSRRAQLAAWCTDAQNPYFAKATVNRVWATLFGRPLVEPVDNLDTDTPHPLVLQLLADDFTLHGFDLRRLILLIASTEVYQLDSATDHEPAEGAEKAWAIFPLSRLRPDQVAGCLLQAASVTTLNGETHIVGRFVRLLQENEFLKRYGAGDDEEFDGRGGTIPQRLLLMNGTLIHERTKDNLTNASGQIALLAPDDRTAVEAIYLVALTRRPTSAESAHFEALLANGEGSRSQRLEDIAWALLNSTEFSWNH